MVEARNQGAPVCQVVWLDRKTCTAGKGGYFIFADYGVLSGDVSTQVEAGWEGEVLRLLKGSKNAYRHDCWPEGTMAVVKRGRNRKKYII